MRRLLILSIVLCVGLTTACREAQGEVIEDPLILELGGDSPSLDEILAKHAPVPVGEPSTATRSGAGQPAATPAAEQRVPHHPLRHLPSAAPRERKVRLPPGWTLSKLCSEELGDSSRWREIAELNGWTEEDLNRLPSGAEVRLPAD